jgi:general secretion pathway protein A
LKSHAAGQSSVLIIDEAQNLDAAVLEQLRLLTNLETNERKLLQIVLIGQPELRVMLQRPELEQLAQRVIARFHLDALNEAETAHYIAHRLAVAGHSGALPFDKRSLQRIHRLSRGVPRRINLLSGRALLGAWANGLQRVDRAVVEKAATEVFGPEVTSMAARSSWPTTYALGAGVVLAGAASAAFLLWPQPQKAQAARQVALKVPQVAASSLVGLEPSVATSAPARQVAASAAGRVPPLVPSSMEELEALLAQLPRDINAAWRELAPTWKLAASDGDSCQFASTQQLQCYRTGKLSMPLLRQLGRPGILTLQEGDGPPMYAVLIGLSDQSATLQVAGKPHSVRLVSLGRLWRGDFATYWRPPTGYSADLNDPSSAVAVQRLASQLSLLDGVPPPVAPASSTLDATLRTRVRAFQRAQGLKPDGQPGPMTFMQIDSATGGHEPRLQTHP